jgi:hypothetical protein
MILKNVLITLSIVAGVLVLITFYVVFYSGGGTYVISSLSGPEAEIFSTSTASTSTLGIPTSTASSTPSSTLGGLPPLASSTPSSTVSSTVINAAPITWNQGNEVLSVTTASITGSQLTLGVQVAMGSVAECVPLDIRLIADEEGDLSPPITSQFSFPDTGTCNGTPGETYSAQPIVFILPTTGTFPIVFTTGGSANMFFEVAQDPDGTLTLQLPPAAD